MEWELDIFKILCFDIIPSLGDVSTDVLNGIDMLIGLDAWIGTTITDDTNKNDTSWGTLAILLIFAPGIPSGITFLLDSNRTSKDWLFAMLYTTCYPFVMLTVQFWQLCNLRKDLSKDNFSVALVAALYFEAFYQSSPQMALQIFALQYGYKVTALQIITFVISFALLTKSAIKFDLMICNQIKNDKFDMFKYVVHVLPVYMSAIVFRIGSLSIIIAYLRYWSVLPIIFRTVIYAILAWRLGYGNRYIPIAAFSNLGSMTRGTTDAKSKTEDTWRFLFLSTLLTFLMETLFLVCILVATIINPTIFVHWQTGLVYFDSTIAIISSIIGVGILNIVLLFVTRKILQELKIDDGCWNKS